MAQLSQVLNEKYRFQRISCRFMWWMLIPLSPDTLSVDERTDPPHMVLKKQSQTVSSRAYSQRNAYNAVSGSDTMLNRELIVGNEARPVWPGQPAAPCSWTEPVLAPGAYGRALATGKPESHSSCLCQSSAGWIIGSKDHHEC